MARISYISDPKDLSWTAILPEEIEYDKPTGPKEDRVTLVNNLVAAFDIEVTSSFIDGKKVTINYTYQFMLYNLETQKYAFWIFREGEELTEFFDYTLPKGLNLMNGAFIYTAVHNLNYEFVNTMNLFDKRPDSIFFNGSSRTIAKFEGRCLMFRDTAQLKPTTLANIGKDLGIPKGEDFDYELIRTPLTPLTDDEVSYCFYDVYILCKFIEDVLKDEESINGIPLTQTSYVRRDLKRIMNRKENRKYKNDIRKLTMDPYTHRISRDSFYGGYTHANPLHAGKVLKDVKAFDVSSMYPTIIACEYFPMSPWKRVQVQSIDDLKELSKQFCFMLYIKVTNLFTTSRRPVIYDAPDKQIQKGKKTDGGKIYQAEELTVALADKDFFTFLEDYTFDSLEILGDVFISMKGYLPTPIVKYNGELYVDKTALKGIEDQIRFYNSQKVKLNSIYGMLATDPVRPLFIWDPVSGLIEKIAPDEVATLEQLEEYNNDKGRAISSFWGPWVTMHARHKLFELIDELGDDFVYCDTDSVYLINDHDEIVEKLNQKQYKKIEEAQKYHGFDKDFYRPKTIKGDVRPLGEWDVDGYYHRFKTLGPKRYLTTELMEDGTEGNPKLTHSGLAKDVVDYIWKEGGFEFYSGTFTIPAEHSGKLAKTYITEPNEGVITDYLGIDYHFKTDHGLHLTPTSYTSSLDRPYIDYIKFIQGK